MLGTAHGADKKVDPVSLRESSAMETWFSPEEYCNKDSQKASDTDCAYYRASFFFFYCKAYCLVDFYLFF